MINGGRISLDTLVLCWFELIFLGFSSNTNTLTNNMNNMSLNNNNNNSQPQATDLLFGSAPTQPVAAPQPTITGYLYVFFFFWCVYFCVWPGTDTLK